MSENRENLLTRMIRVYGFEHEITAAFSKLMENPSISDYTLETIVKAHEETPFTEEEW